MNLLLLEEGDRESGAARLPADGRYVVRGERARPLVETLGAGPGKRVRVGLVEGPLGEGEVVAVTGVEGSGAVRTQHASGEGVARTDGGEGAGAHGDGSPPARRPRGRTALDAARLAVTLACRFEGSAPPRALTDLVLAVPRPKVLARLLPEIAALGVDRLVLLRCWRSETPYLHADVVTDAAHRDALLREGLAQARSTRLPIVSVEPLFRPFVEDRAPALVEGSIALALHPGVEADVAALDVPRGARVCVAIGPEGGFTPYEIDALGRAGFRAAHMGPRILDTETAVPVALGLVDALRRRGPIASASAAAPRPEVAGAEPHHPQEEAPR